MRPSLTVQGQRFASVTTHCLPEPVSPQNKSFVERFCRSYWFDALFRNAIAILLLFAGFAANAQSRSDSDPTRTPTLPPSPNAASLGKYGNVPVSYYTGIPSINISLYEIKTGDLSLPISLDYHAGGIRVEEIASWVGLGWSLNAGGVITRTIRGIADDSPMEAYGYYKNNIDYLTDGSKSFDDLQTRFRDVFDNGHGDTEPDIYAFNFGGHSGKFFLGEDGQTFYPIPQQKISIAVEQRNGRLIERWKIKTEDGVEYFFGKSTDSDGLEYNTSYSVSNGNTSAENREASSWFLIKIVSPKGYTISFDYEAYTYSFRTFGSETAYYVDRVASAGAGEDKYSSSYMRNDMEGRRLKSITFTGGKVEFKARDTFRADLGDKALESMNIYRVNEISPFKSYKLKYSYFVPSPGDPVPAETALPVEQDETGSAYRLKLLSVAEAGADTVSNPPYRFYYNETKGMPARIPHYMNVLAYGHDHWGYYNGKTNNTRDGGTPTIIPSFQADLGGGIRLITGADRSADENFMDTYVLQKMTYPTGGYTEFEYKANKVLSTSFPDPFCLPFESKAVSTSLHSSDNTGSATSEIFSINSGTSRNGVYGAYVDVKLMEMAYGAGVCEISDPAVDRNMYRAADDVLVYSNTALTNGEQIFIPNGTYYIRLDKKNDHFCESSFNVILTWKNYAFNTGSQVKDIAVGGLRVEKITDHDGKDHNKDVIRYFQYNQFSDSTRSSGQLVSFPIYAMFGAGELYGELFSHVDQAPPPRFYQVWNSYTSYPLATTSGSYVGYSNVKVEFGLHGANGKTEYTFTNASDYPDIVSDGAFRFPFPPLGNVDWRRGKLLKEVSYRKSGNAFYPVSEQRSYYNFHSNAGSPLLTTAAGMKLGTRIKQVEINATTLDWAWCSPLSSCYPPYYTRTEWVTLDSTVTITYDNSPTARQFKTRTDMYYLPTHQQLWKKIQQGSDGSIITDYFTYPEDYPGINSSSTGLARGVWALQQKGIFNEVIESYKVKELDGEARVLSAQLSAFKENPSNVTQPVVDAVYALETSVPLPSSGAGAFKPAVVQSNSLRIDSAYVKNIVFTKHDALHGNILEFAKKDNFTTAYIWGYNSALPVAEVQNASADQVVYNSFEDNGVLSTLAKSGSRYWNGVYNLPLPTQQGTYRLTYWTKSGSSKWTLTEQTLIVNSSNAGTTYSIGAANTWLDEVRLIPQRAVMTTFTYDPLVGITSKTDATNLTTYYFYDSHSRLSHIEDQDGNIVKQFIYHYKQ